MPNSTRARELETLLLTMFAAVPLYATAAIGIPPVIVFHAVMIGIAIRVATGRSPELIPAAAMRVLAILMIPGYIIDAIVTRSAISASTHLVLFIAAYQPIESVRTDNRAQRLLTTALIFVASVATSTHISIILFVLLFTFLMFRQMMTLSHVETMRALGKEELAPQPSARAALFYLCGTALIGAALFPLLPRVRNPLIQGGLGALTGATTGLSDAIDFAQERSSAANDARVVARVWMSAEAIPFFTPLRLRGSVYDRYARTRWVQTQRGLRPLESKGGRYRVARPVGFTRTASVQQQEVKANKLFLPTGTYMVSGVPQLFEGPTRDAYATFQPRRQALGYQVWMAREVAPMRKIEPQLTGYPISPEVSRLAREIVGRETNPYKVGVAIDSYLLRNFRYYQRPEQVGRPMNLEEFLLKERRGHCEYFAAGMVVLLNAVNVPARIVGGFYGGQLNPLTGYFVVRLEDAHAWVELWDGEKWLTFDPTPATLRPGNAQTGLLRLYAAAIGDSVTYFWDRYVLTFGLGDQVALALEMLYRVRDAFSAARRLARGGIRIGAIDWQMVGIIVSIVAALLFVLYLLRQRESAFELLAAHLRRLGIEIGPATTMEEALARLREEKPLAAQELAPLIALYEEERFSPRVDRSRVRQIKRRLSELRV